MSFVLSLQVMADEVANKNKELIGLQSKIKSISKNINSLSVKKNALLLELKRLDKQYGKSAVFLRQVEEQVGQQKQVLKQNRQELNLKKQEITSQLQGLEHQLKAAYRMGKNEKLKLILNQQNPALSGRILVYYDFLNKTRLKKISDFQLDLLQLRELEAERIKESDLLENKLRERKLERSVLSRTRDDRKALLVKIDRQFTSKQQQLNRFKASEQRLKKLIASLQSTMDDFPLDEGVVKEFYKLKGKLPWPVKGRLIKKFGERRSDSRWDGVLIAAKEGTDIRAVTRGRVVYADWLRGYGLLTIIDHGKGYMTLYAFNQSLFKSVGDWVDVGTVIASIGQSGGQSNAGLYFGIRKKGKPVNPVKWCRKRR